MSRKKQSPVELITQLMMSLSLPEAELLMDTGMAIIKQRKKDAETFLQTEAKKHQLQQAEASQD